MHNERKTAGYAALSILSLAILSGAVYAHAYGHPYLFDSDMLMPEHMYRDFFLEGGKYSNWLLPSAPAYLDSLLYFTIRFFTTNVSTSIAAYSAAQTVLLAIAAWFAVAPAFDSSTKRAAVGVFTAAAALAVSYCGADMMTINRCVYHVVSLIMATFAMGCVIRVLLGQARPGVLSAFALISVVSYAHDPVYTVWAIAPAGLAALVLAIRKSIRWSTLLKVAAALLLLIIGGVLLGAILTPGSMGHSLATPSFERLVKVLPKAIANIRPNLFESPLNICVSVTGNLGVVLAVLTKGRARTVSLYYVCVALSAVFGITVNGESEARFLLPAFILLPLIGWPLLFLLVTDRIAGQKFIATNGSCASGNPRRNGIAVALVCFLALCGISLTFAYAYVSPRKEFYPAYIRELDELAAKRGITTGFANFREGARTVSILSKNGLRMARSHDTTLIELWPDLTSQNTFRDRYQMVVLYPFESFLPYMVALMKFVNGEPEEELTLSNGIRVLIYSERGGRMANFKDYYSFPDEHPYIQKEADKILWEGEKDFGDGVVLTKVEKLKRLTKTFLLIHVKNEPEKIMGKIFTIRLGGDKHPWIKKKAARLLERSDGGTFDFILESLLWSVDEIASYENTIDDIEGGTIIYSKIPNKHAMDWRVLIIEEGPGKFRVPQKASTSGNI